MKLKTLHPLNFKLKPSEKTHLILSLSKPSQVSLVLSIIIFDGISTSRGILSVSESKLAYIWTEQYKIL